MALDISIPILCDDQEGQAPLPSILAAIGQAEQLCGEPVGIDLRIDILLRGEAERLGELDLDRLHVVRGI